MNEYVFAQQPRRRGRTLDEPMTPEEQDSILAELGQSSLGGLAYIGSALDKPGRAVRGVLSGLTGGDFDGGLLNLIPFSDSLGITDSDPITGRDLLEGWGLVGANTDQGWIPDAGDLAGFAADLALDPTTYLSFGGSALTKLGKAAQKVGGLAPAVRGAGDVLEMGAREAQMLAGQSGLATFGFPGMDKITLGTGPTAQKIAHGLDFAGESLRYGELGNVPLVGQYLPETLGQFSPGRQAAALFSKANKDVYGKAGQIAAQAMTEAERRAGEEALRVPLQAYADLKELGLNPDDQFNMLSKAVEGVSLSPDELTLLGPDRAIRFQEIADTMRGAERANFDALRGTGRNLAELTPENMEYFSRYAADKVGGRGGAKIFPNTVDSSLHRNPALRDIPRHLVNAMSEGKASVTDVLQQVGLDPSAMTRFNERKVLLEAILSDPTTMHGNLVTVLGTNAPTDDLIKMANQEIKGLTEKLSIPNTLEGMFATPSGKPLYNDPAQDFARYQRQTAQAAAASDGIAGFLEKYAGPAQPGQESLANVLKKAKFADANGNLTPEIIQRFQKKHPGVDINTLGVDADIAADVTRMIDGFHTPEALAPLLKIVDGFTGAFKAGVTTPFPSFHVRNFVTGVWQNLVGGAMDPQSYGMARRLMGGEVVPEALEHPLVQAAGITDASKASDFLRSKAYQYNVTGQSFTNEVTGKYLPPSENFAGNIVGEPGAELSLLGKGNPLEAGVEGFQAAQGSNSIMRLLKGGLATGNQGGNLVEGLNRMAGFLSLTKQGYDPTIAAAKTRALHVDFSNLSGFEKAAMRRLVPFYSFSRGMLPEVLKELIERPGGYSGQLAQATTILQDDDTAFLPEHLRGGIGLPIGAEVDGNQKYLTNLDLPIEGIFEPLHSGPNAFTKTGEALLGMTNPLFKGPLEAATGRSFFHGRDLRDLYSPTGSSLADQLIGNSPLSRVRSTISTLADDRKSLFDKAVNLGTGIRLSDVDIAKQREIQSRELLQDDLRGEEGIGVFDNLYVRPDVELSPEQAKKYALY